MTRVEKKIVKPKLSVLQLASALDNVSEACRRRGISSTQFYEYKRRFQLYGIEGLKDLPPIHKSHPQTTPTGYSAVFRLVFETKPLGRNFMSLWRLLQKDLDQWLEFYNYEQPHQGYRNRGKKRFDTIKEFVENVREES